jgi:hypothetical protein
MNIWHVSCAFNFSNKSQEILIYCIDCKSDKCSMFNYRDVNYIVKKRKKHAKYSLSSFLYR